MRTWIEHARRGRRRLRPLGHVALALLCVAGSASLWTALLPVGATPIAEADGAAAPRPDEPDAPPSAPSDGVVRFPGLRVHPAAGFLEIDGQVCLHRGLIEVFACTEYGKVHEAVLILGCRPEHLQLGLILLGMSERRGQVKALGEAGGALVGERAIVTVRWEEDGERFEHRAEDLLLDAHDGKTMEHSGWTFTGSRFIQVAGREVFAANASGQMITTFHDPDAILDNPSAKGDDDTVYYANSRILPLPGTKVTVHIRPMTAAEALAAGASAPGAPGADPATPTTPATHPDAPNAPEAPEAPR